MTFAGGITLSSDGSRLAVAGGNGVVHVIDVANLRETFQVWAGVGTALPLGLFFLFFLFLFSFSLSIISPLVASLPPSRRMLKRARAWRTAQT